MTPVARHQLESGPGPRCSPKDCAVGRGLCCAQHQAQPVLLSNRQGLCCGELETPTPELF